MKNVEIKCSKKLEKLLTKICLDFKIDNYKEEINYFIKNKEKMT